MKILPTEKFTRIHRSYAVANECITAFNQREVSIGKVKIPIGGSCKEELMN